MKLFGLLGFPLKRSASPALMNSLFSAVKQDAVYLSLPTPPPNFLALIKTMHSQGFQGANITVPYKRKVLRALDFISQEARAIGAVNVLAWRGGRVEGHNTDADGFLSALKNEKIDPKGRRALVLGAGGAARAVIFALLSAGARGVFVSARRLAQAAAVGRQFVPLFPGHFAAPLPWDRDALGGVLKEVSLVINATPIGMGAGPGSCPPLPFERLGPGHWVFDLVYDPPDTRLLMRAHRRGARVVNGASMLAYQAAKSLDIWFGKGLGEQALLLWKPWVRAAARRAGRNSR